MTTLQAEKAVNVLGVDGRAFAVIAAPDGRILNQTIKATRYYTQDGQKYRITAELRFDDQCRNGHEDFAITADIREAEGGYWRDIREAESGYWREHSGGCCHEEIARRFPEFAPLIKWHLCGIDGPMHYPDNALYHADEHGPDSAWIYYTAPAGDPLGLGGHGERLLCYARKAKASEAEGKPGYRVVWDEKTAKARNLNGARHCAAWPEATDAELSQEPDTLRAALLARLPALLADFKADLVRVGFVWPTLPGRRK